MFDLRTAAAALLALGLLAHFPGLSRAQQSSSGTWTAAVNYRADRLSGGQSSWQRWNASVKRAAGSTTVMAAFVRDRRFGTADEAAVLQAWQDLWSGAYGHVRAEVSPSARIRPRQGLSGDLHQAFGAWVVSARYGWSRYRRQNVHRFGPGLAVYAGDWYLYTQATVVPRSETWAAAQRAGARRYVGPDGSYVEAMGGVGRSVELVGADPGGGGSAIAVGRTAFASLRARYRLTQRVGIQASAGYSDSAFYRRSTASLGLSVRW